MGWMFAWMKRWAVTVACGMWLVAPVMAQTEIGAEEPGTNTVPETVTNAVEQAVADRVGMDLPQTEPSAMAIFTKEMVEQLKEKQQATLDALKEAQLRIDQTAQLVEQSRTAAETNAVAAAKSMEDRLQTLEDKLAMQRSRDLKNLQNSQQFTLVVICVIAGLGIAGVAAMSIYMLRYIHRRTDLIGMAQPMGATPYSAGALGNGDTRLAAGDPAAQSSAQLLGALERMEKRMLELEVGNPSPDLVPVNGTGLGEVSAAARAQAELQARVSLLLGKGQSLISLEQFDDAIACFDEALELDAANAEAYVKKGTVLEKQGHLDEAIENYDQAIALDDSLTMAYLCKGGVYNRLDRYNEALQCYEQALRAQQNARIAG